MFISWQRVANSQKHCCFLCNVFPILSLQIVIYGEIPKNKENIIYLSNHQCTGKTSTHPALPRSSPLKGEIIKYVPTALFLADWIIADMLAIRQSALGHVRYVLKDGLKWLPLYGWYFSQVIRLCEYLNVCKLQLGRWKWVLNYNPTLIT